jgi:hypothetical protein
VGAKVDSLHLFPDDEAEGYGAQAKGDDQKEDEQHMKLSHQ